ncbi:MAG: zinc-binding dehydrogenase [Promethearchaeota archaeon]
MKTMKAAVFHGVRDVRLEDVPVPEVGPGEVLVKVKAALTCGTDRKSFLRGMKKPTDAKVPYAKAIRIFGHEYAGDVVEVGEGVSQFKAGQRVVSANSAPCNRCFYCKNGRHSLCENLTWLWGAFAEYVKIPAPIVEQNTMVIPDHVAYEEAALTEPLACVLQGVERSGIGLGDWVVINGVGPIGLMFVVLVKLKGAFIVVTDLSDERLAVAKRLGADVTINAGNVEDVVAEVKRNTPGGRGADVAIEAIGSPATWEKTVLMGRKGATINLFGGCPSNTSIKVDTSLIHYSELNLLGIFHHAPRYIRRAFDLICAGKIPTKEIVTHRMPLSDVQKALEMIVAGEGIKIALIP